MTAALPRPRSLRATARTSAGSKSGDARPESNRAGLSRPLAERPRAVRIVGGGIGLVGVLAIAAVVLFVAVFPTSEYLAQRDELSQRRAELEQTQAAIAEVETELGRFDDQVSISRIARERFSLVTEGEQLFRLTTRGGDTAAIPDAWLWPGFERLVRGE